MPCNQANGNRRRQTPPEMRRLPVDIVECAKELQHGLAQGLIVTWLPAEQPILRVAHATQVDSCGAVAVEPCWVPRMPDQDRRDRDTACRSRRRWQESSRDYGTSIWIWICCIRRLIEALARPGSAGPASVMSVAHV
jgi:hypothetical protein